MKKQKIHLVHGWTYTLDNWAGFLKELKKAGFDPIVHKVPGLTEPSDEVWTVDGYVEWLRELIKDKVDPVMLGHSNGGRILLAYSGKYPKHIKHLILLDSAGVVEGRSNMRLKRRIGGVVAKIIKPLVPEGKPRRALYRFIGARDYGNAKPNMRETMKNMLDHDKHLDIASIKTPTTLIWGEHDLATPISQGLTMKEQLGNVISWTVIKNAGHSPQINHAEDVVSIIKRDVHASL